MKFCHKCGQQLEDGDAFCYKCGVNVSNINISKNNFKTPIIILLSLLLVCTGIFVYENYDKKTPTNIAQNSRNSSRPNKITRVEMPKIDFDFNEIIERMRDKETSTNNSMNLTEIKTPQNVQLPEFTYTPINSNRNIDSAKFALIEYYTAIADGNFRTAYNMLSYSMQDYMNSFSDFVAGHADVISNDVSNISVISSDDDEVILRYTLTSRDKFNGKVRTQIFYGTATLNNFGGDWIITDFNVRKS